MKKILIISDTHLTDRFDRKKFMFLQKIIGEADQVIINGDFWDGYITTFSRFINSSWKKLFAQLRRKKTVYLYGNHDPKEMCDKRASKFSVKQLLRYDFKFKDVTYRVEHGQAFEPGAMGIFHLIPDIRNVQVAVNIFLGKVEGVLLKIFGIKFVRNILYGQLNNDVKKKIKPLLKPKEVFVFGHTHKAEIDLKNGLVDSGFIRHGLGTYLTLDENGIKLREEWYSR